MKEFTEFQSKKKLREANVLTAEQYAFVHGIKGMFTSALHRQNRYMAITLYHIKPEPHYAFLVADLETETTQPAQSIKMAKDMIRSIYGNTMPGTKKTIPSALNYDITIPRPSPEQVELYLQKWDDDAELYGPEKMLKELFQKTCVKNTSIDEIMLKVATLNTVYGTHIYSVYPVAEHILSLNIDERLCKGDAALVNELMCVTYKGGKKIDHYSFAAKYCSFHKPELFPIYDSYVDKILRYYRDKEGFCTFYNADLKDYEKFKSIIDAFKQHFGLQDYSIKKIDQYLWQFGKEYF